MNKAAIVKHEGGQYVLYSHKGKVLGTHPSYRKAMAQEKAIEMNKQAEAIKQSEYEAGFISKCASAGVDPVALVKQAQIMAKARRLGQLITGSRVRRQGTAIKKVTEAGKSYANAPMGSGLAKAKQHSDALAKLRTMQDAEKKNVLNARKTVGVGAAAGLVGAGAGASLANKKG